MSLVFEKQYRERGFDSQKRYPNEGLIQFLGGNYFHLPLSKRNKIKILELGCGSGANLWMIAKEGFDAYGIDSAPTGIKLCRKMLKKWGVKAKLKVADMRALPFEGQFFDVIVDLVSVQHVSFSDHLKVFKEVYRCLKKGGRFYGWHLSDNSISFKKSGGKIIDKYTVDNIRNSGVPLYGNGLTCFIPNFESSNLLKKTGFKNINIEKVSRTYKNGKQKMEYLSMQALK